VGCTGSQWYRPPRLAKPARGASGSGYCWPASRGGARGVRWGPWVALGVAGRGGCVPGAVASAACVRGSRPSPYMAGAAQARRLEAWS
jgi:hypothetical protein